MRLHNGVLSAEARYAVTNEPGHGSGSFRVWTHESEIVVYGGVGGEIRVYDEDKEVYNTKPKKRERGRL